MKHTQAIQASVESSKGFWRARSATVRKTLLLPFALLVLLVARGEAATCTWVAAGLTSNFSEALNWDAVPSPDAILVFPAGPPFAAKGAPVNDLGYLLDVDSINIYESYVITGNAITCKNINVNNNVIATVALPISTFGAAVLTVIVTDAPAILYLPGLISGAGPVTYAGPGTKRLNGTVNNTVAGLTSVALGNLVLDSTAAEAIAGPMIIDSGAIVTLVNAPDIKNTVTVTVNGTLDISTATGGEGADTETLGGLAGNGTVSLGANSLGCTAQAAPTNFSGGFSGTGGFHQSGSGIQVLSGNSSTNTGAAILDGGELHIWGTQPTAPINVTAGTLVLANDCTVGDVSLGGGAASTLSFYETITAMNLHGTTPNLTVGSGSGFQVVALGPAPTLYSYVTTAAVTLTGAVLTIDTTVYTPIVGSLMTIVENTGAGVVNGTFAGLVEGATVASSTDPGCVFTISYVGGTGNDVTLLGVLPDLTAPVISAVAVGSLTTSSAAVSWTTDEVANSQVEYGLTAAYGSLTVLDASLVLSHDVPLAGLTIGTLYHFRVLSSDAAGNPAVSADGTFTTSADSTAPVISAVAVGSLTISSAAVSWTTDEAANSQVEYGLTAAYGSLTVLDAGLVLSHDVPLAGLTTNTLYHFRVLSSDAAGNPALSADGTFTTSADLRAPVISAVAVGSLTISSAAVSWTTDEAASSQVEYGLTAAYGSLTVLDAGLVLAHDVPLAGLTAGTLYHFRVLSSDAAGNPALSADGTFTTTAAAAGVATIENGHSSGDSCGLGSAISLLAMFLLMSLRLSAGKRRLG